MKAQYQFYETPHSKCETFSVEKYLNRPPKKEEFIDIPEDFLDSVPPKLLHLVKHHFEPGKYYTFWVQDLSSNPHTNYDYNIHLVKCSESEKID